MVFRRAVARLLPFASLGSATHLRNPRHLVWHFSRRMMATDEKRMKTEEMETGGRRVIGTHDGQFHCDEVLACAMLGLLAEYRDAEIRRSRDAAVLDQCDVVVDVGAVFDPAAHRYDHHQRSFQETYASLRPGAPWKTKLSSAGLVYVHFGRRVVAAVLGVADAEADASPLVTAVHERVYENFVEEVDAVDNGIATHDGPARYRTTTGLSARVGYLNSPWNEPSDADDQMRRFRLAMDLVRAEFTDRVKYFAHSWWPARELVVRAMEDRNLADPSGRIVELSQGGCPWKEHLFALEQSMGLEPGHILYVVYPDRGGSWRVQGVPPAPQSFELRLALPEAWRGLRNAELDQVSGIDGCIFVHAAGFIGGHGDRQGALRLARRSIELASGL